jgi:hypothetical protein
MTDQKTGPNSLEMGAAILVTCVVQTLNESDSTFQSRFLKKLEQAYSEIRDGQRASPHTLEELSWVRELLTGFSVSRGQGEPFLS